MPLATAISCSVETLRAQSSASTAYTVSFIVFPSVVATSRMLEAFHW